MEKVSGTCRDVQLDISRSALSYAVPSPCSVLVIFKDIPDVEGDKIDGIDSFACKFGPKAVFAHSILGFILWRKANLVDLKNNEAIESFYLFIWKLYCVEYLLVPFLRF
ncbi:hypothetical protein Tco_1047046 [Tanacetum coccineum]